MLHHCHKSHQAMFPLQKCQKKEPQVTFKTLSSVARMEESLFLNDDKIREE